MVEHSYFLSYGEIPTFWLFNLSKLFWGYGCFLKWWYPQNTPKGSFLVGKPMVVGYHHFRKPPYGSWFIVHPHKINAATVSQNLPSRLLGLHVGSSGSAELHYLWTTPTWSGTQQSIPKKTVLHPNTKSTSFLYILFKPSRDGERQNKSITLPETNISPKNGILKMIFLFPRWDMFVNPGGYMFLHKKSLQNKLCLKVP